MPRVSEEHRQRQRDRIKAATLRVFQEHGLGGASMNDVIKASGLSAGAIYGYFKNKDELVAAVAADLVSGRVEVIDELAARTPIAPPLDMARALVRSFPVALVNSGLVLEVWGAAGRDEVLGAFARRQLDGITEAVERYLRAWYAQEGDADPDTTARAVAPVLVAVAQGYLVRLAIGGERSGEEYLAGLGLLADRLR